MLSGFHFDGKLFRFGHVCMHPCNGYKVGCPSQLSLDGVDDGLSDM